MDAGAFGARLTPRDAYVFAKGNEITTSSGQRARLSRPLDFLVVADHSDGMGFFPLVVGGDAKIMADPQGRKWHDMIHTSKGAEAALDIIVNFEYARSGLKLGLKLEKALGANPYKFGMIGSSDAHTGLAAMEEENFFGKTAPQEPSPERMTKTFMHDLRTGVKIMDWEVSSSGYAAVWATENTREALFDAMERRETYATTGPRMIVRFFGGWDFAPQDAQNRLPAGIGYTKGVPMGGDLRDAPAGKAPTFLVAALKDPIGANLDRIQIIKGWLDAKGDVHEKVYDVVWGDADKRQPGANGTLPPVGNTVDVDNAIWTNTIGDPELITVWKDPDFDAQQRAFYYARVLEIPTPRWTAYDAKRFGVKPLPGTTMTLQERAYTSPIWYTP